jgi:hypothetical protein
LVAARVVAVRQDAAVQTRAEFGGSVMSYRVYEPETIRALSQALRAAMDNIERTVPNALFLSGRPAVTNALVANLLAAADSGERDPERLRAIALDWARANFYPTLVSRVA